MIMGSFTGGEATRGGQAMSKTMLPGRSGLDITRMLKADDDLKNIPVLAVTSFAMEGDRERILESGCDGYIPKPITINGFLETVARHLSTPGLRAPRGVS
ncbi:MAG: response regulator [Proteobacteria bacterium]|nr:response regulator [Pseudomonadota bacterium]